ncbi:MAG: PEP-utilizing enzyme [bacterium]|nr:PEP-utilizing enzyme [bacterium]
MTRKIIKYEKVITRDAPLILIAAWYKSFTDSIPRVFDFEVKFPESIYIFQNGAFESWRATQLFFGTLPKAMSRWAKDPKNAQRILAEFDRYIKIGKKLKKEKVQPISSVKSLKAVNKIKKVQDLFIDGVAGLIPAYWCVTWNEAAVKQKKKSLFSKKILDKATKLRQADTFFDDACDLMYQYLYLIAAEKGWPKNLMKFFLIQELKKAVMAKQKYSFTEVEKRKDGCAYFAGKLFTENDISTALKIRGYKLIDKKILSAATQLKGFSASPGQARGKVKVVMNRDQLNKIMPGDILVSPMTTPAYLPAMTKAAAFVTDEGGIICHAAIVAREMKKPCIVGTKVATKILQDGDLVEVDAHNGIVKIIERAE